MDVQPEWHGLLDVEQPEFQLKLKRNYVDASPGTCLQERIWKPHVYTQLLLLEPNPFQLRHATVLPSAIGPRGFLGPRYRDFRHKLGSISFICNASERHNGGTRVFLRYGI